jgi:pre-mRNA-splicing helicase BRR2
LPTHVCMDLEKGKISLDDILRGNEQDMIAYAVGSSFSEQLYKFVQHIPFLETKITTKTLTRSILEIHLTIYPQFVWNNRWNGKSEPFWVIISNGEEIFT